MKRLVFGFCLSFVTAIAVPADNRSLFAQDHALSITVADLLDDDPAKRQNARDVLVRRGKPDVAAAIIQVLRFIQDDGEMDAALASLTGEASGSNSWAAWMLWQQAHPEVTPFDGFDQFKADLMAAIDPNFRVFLYPNINHEIRLEEIVWGGVVKDGIPALTNPRHITPEEADYITQDELVFGVEINGDA
ncbi:MAG: hypothetical protein AAGA73_20995, partial [Pseudomonadota bacterium]